MADLDKSRIEVLRDALKDVSDTIRAQDRKISYMLVIVLFLLSGYFMNVLNFFDKESFSDIELLNLFPLIYLIISVILFFTAYSPVSNPSEVLNDEDKEFCEDKFFIFYTEDKVKCANELSTNFLNDSSDIKSLARIIYVEILKLSKIREKKIKLIKHAVHTLLISVILMFLTLITSFEYIGVIIAITIIFELLRYIFAAWVSDNNKVLKHIFKY